MTKKILVVDDEHSIVTLLQFNLEQAGYTVVTALDGKTALYLADKENPDLIILDLMLPEIDGLEVCKTLRNRNNLTPIMMLTAKDDELDKILGLELGADDYLTKPFSPREVVARVKAILRRTDQNKGENARPAQKIAIGDLVINPEQFEVRFKDKIVELTPKEFELLLYLARHKGRVLTREQLLNAIWNYDYIGDTRIVDVHISHLRDKIEPSMIKTIRGLGYKLDWPDRDE
ncbi:two component transcriptional regulator, winged helix family [Caldalkalibacillus thermarum TA2.A1]|uniref:Response regulator transcription factor n=1 Tax=Caldalkalibacillus thermarum (strain TA2.A1) TaxID=986075 RepID=F5L947_CALTT|nr:response regulator transcription factor [Caldalkalibacillus thermarum]EGL82121.1 two component transcriptional regulator, winged helix family [Caldalkalibacillus thermarum TA2.A1]QZT34949.1 response regulator transcription factor [Caldalkalibacillus thermarum TA2.A1]